MEKELVRDWRKTNWRKTKACCRTDASELLFHLFSVLTHPWMLYSLIMIRIYTNVLGSVVVVMRIETFGHRTQFLMILEIGPSPDTTINDMGKTLFVGNLETTVQTFWNCYTFRKRAGIGQCILEIFYCT